MEETEIKKEKKSTKNLIPADFTTVAVNKCLEKPSLQTDALHSPDVSLFAKSFTVISALAILFIFFTFPKLFFLGILIAMQI